MGDPEPPWLNNPVKEEVIENLLLTTLQAYAWMLSGRNDTVMKLLSDMFTDTQVSEAKAILFQKCAPVEAFISKNYKKEKNWHSGQRTGGGDKEKKKEMEIQDIFFALDFMMKKDSCPRFILDSFGIAKIPLLKPHEEEPDTFVARLRSRAMECWILLIP